MTIVILAKQEELLQLDFKIICNHTNIIKWIPTSQDTSLKQITLEILHVLDKRQKINILEAYEIQILNDQVDLFQSDCFEFLLGKITNFPPP